ncbi:MAG TPA: hypothetical protein VHE35_03095 [Kofleriaceae bacterium]|nr:hypothetical protein [Kofleriaceae bacterium]
MERARTVATVVVPLALAALAALAACEPDLGNPGSLVGEARVLAIRSEPAEVKPGQDVMLSALVVDPTGTLMPDIGWGFCGEPAPLSSNNVASDACVFTAISLPARGVAITATIPVDTCSNFGPTPPAPEPGEPQRRPHDADVTGGYYQPIRALVNLSANVTVPSIGLTRTTCDLANAPIDVVVDFRARYHANVNPRIVSVIAQRPGEAEAVSLPAELPAHTDIALRVRWSDDSAETYPVFDPQSRALVDHREAIRVSWFVTGGELESERTGRTEDETESYADDVWTTPDAGPAHLWLVVRDSRGGMDFRGFDLTITP